MTRLACSTYSFQNLITQGVLTQFDTLALAKEMGFDGIEIVDLQLPAATTPDAYVAALKAELTRLDFPITSFTFSANLLQPDAAQQAEEVARIKTLIDYAVILGAPRIRHDVAWQRLPGQTLAQTLPHFSAACHEIASYAESQGIVATVENHGFFLQDSQRLEALLTAVNHPNFKLLLDMGNFLCVDENPAVAFSRLAPFAEYVHFKDFHQKLAQDFNPGQGFFTTRGGNYLRGAIVGHGNVPIKQCLQILKQADYQGDFALEFEGIEDNHFALEHSLKNARALLASV